MKFAGAVMICAACTFWGIKKGEEIKKHYEQMLYIKKLLIMIRGEIKYNCGILGEVFLNISEKIKAPYNKIFSDFSYNLENCDGGMFNEKWETEVINEIIKQTDLKMTDVEELKELGLDFGYLDISMQLNYIDLCIDRLSEKIKTEHEKMEGGVKLARVLGIMSGVLITIIII